MINKVKTEWDLERHFFKSIDDPKISESINVENN